MITREEAEEYRRRWKLFNEWEAEQPPRVADLADILDDLDTILECFGDEARFHEQDPGKKGVQQLFAAAAVLDRRL